MRKAVFMLMSLVALPLSAASHQQRQIPIIVEAHPVSESLKGNGALLLRISITNGLSKDIHFSTFSLTPNSWNGETTNISLVDIYRAPQEMGRFYARPKIGQGPTNIAGMSSHTIKPTESLSVVVDMSKWQIVDGWIPGRYKITVRADNISLDEYTRASVMSDPVDFVIK
jgi:hypothetical protein